MKQKLWSTWNATCFVHVFMFFMLLLYNLFGKRNFIFQKFPESRRINAGGTSELNSNLHRRPFLRSQAIPSNHNHNPHQVHMARPCTPPRLGGEGAGEAPTSAESSYGLRFFQISWEGIPMVSYDLVKIVCVYRFYHGSWFTYIYIYTMIHHFWMINILT